MRLWAFIFACAWSIIPSLAQGIDPSDLTIARQLLTISLEERQSTRTEELDALSRVLNQPNYVASLKRLADKQQLGEFEPREWAVIDTELCSIAKLDTVRCTTLACLVTDIGTPAAQSCPPLPSGSKEESDSRPRLQDLMAWLKELSTRPDITDLKINADLERGDLPLDGDVILAKAFVQALWPDFQRVLKAEKDPAVSLMAIASGNAARVEGLVRVAAFMRLLDRMSPTVRKSLGPAADELTAFMKRHEKLLEKLGEAVLPIPEVLTSEIERAEKRVRDLAVRLAGITEAATAKVSSAIAKGCSEGTLKNLFELAKQEFDGREVTLSLRAADPGILGSTQDQSAELVVSLKASDGTSGILYQPDGSTKELQILAECSRVVIPLGIYVSQVRLVEGQLVVDAPPGELVQHSDSRRFSQGLSGLLDALGVAQHFPKSLRARDARLRLSPGFENVDLIANYWIPGLDVEATMETKLIVDKKIVFRPDVQSFLSSEEVVKAVNAKLSPSKNLKVAVGPFTATLIEARVPPKPLVDNGTLVQLQAKLGIRDIELPADLYLVFKDGKPDIVMSSDLTPLVRQLMQGVENQGDRILTELRRFAGFDEQMAREIGSALLIQSARLSRDEKGAPAVDVTVALDVGRYLPGIEVPIVTHTGRLDLNATDLGVTGLYKGLLEKAVTENLANAVRERIGAPIESAANAAINEAIRTISQASRSLLGITLSASPSSGEQNARTLLLSWDGGEVEVGKVFVVPGVPPRLDFRGAEIGKTESERLASYLANWAARQAANVIGVDWRPCGNPRVSKGSQGFVFEFSIETNLLGCVPLPALLFDGGRIEFDNSRIAEAIKPVLVEKVQLLIPEEYRRYATIKMPDLSKNRVEIEIKAFVQAIGAELNGTIIVDLKDGRIVDINTDFEQAVAQALFNNALQFVAGLTGDGAFKIEPIPNRIGLRASGGIELGIVRIGVENMEITTDGVNLPEIAVRLPVPVAVGPVTVFPIEIQARLQKPMRIAMVGDISITALQDILKIRGTMGFGIPFGVVDVGGVMNLVHVLDLMQMTGSIDINNKVLTAQSETVGILKAVMPTKQVMVLNEQHATMSNSMQLLGLKASGEAEILFKSPPELRMNGKASLADLANLKAAMATDLELRKPIASVAGGVELKPIGTIGFEARASLSHLMLEANIIGLTASLILPSFDDLNHGMIRKLFESLLKPSIDLDSLRNMKDAKITLSTRIGGGGSGLDGNGGGTPAPQPGTEGNPQNPGGGPAPNEGLQQAPNPQVTYPIDGVPSEWQDAWQASETNPSMFCRAAFKGKIFEWRGATQAPLEVVELYKRPARPIAYLGYAGLPLKLWKNCSEELPYQGDAQLLAFFDGQSQPLGWVEGSPEGKRLNWIPQVITVLEGRNAAAVSKQAPLASGTAETLRIMHERKLEEVAIVPIAVSGTPKLFRLLEPAADGYVHLINPDAGFDAVRSFRRQSTLGRWIEKTTNDPAAPEAALAEPLMPILFEGHEPLVLSEVGGRILLAVFPYRAPPYLAAYSIEGTIACGNRIALGAWPWRTAPGKVADLLAQKMLDPASSCGAPLPDWSTAYAVSSLGRLDRLVLVTNAEGKWSITFVDSQNECIRGTPLTSERLASLSGVWFASKLIDEETSRILSDPSASFERALGAILDPDVDWRERGFPFNPFQDTAC